MTNRSLKNKRKEPFVHMRFSSGRKGRTRGTRIMSKQFVRSAKNLVKGYSSTQVLVRNATSNDNHQVSKDSLIELAEKSYDSADFFEIMDMLDKRLNDKGKYWRHIAKALTVLDYLIRFGSENCVLWCKENLYIIKTLKEFRHEDDEGVDQGQIVRVKAKELTTLLSDDERLNEERNMNIKGRSRKGRKRRGTGRNDEDDDDLQRAIDASRMTAEEDERRRKQDEDYETALQLSKEEEELKRLQDLQRMQQVHAQQQQQQPMYYDIFGNPITPEEYAQFQLQQQQQQLQQQQQQQEAMYYDVFGNPISPEELAHFQQQQYIASLQQQQQVPSNNPFAKPNQEVTSQKQDQSFMASSSMQQQQQQQPLTQTRTGNQSMTDKYGKLNELLATGTGIDTFGNVGDSRVPAQHTKTGTFINSQGTGYRQVSNDPKQNPFLNSQYTGLPSTNIVPTQTGYGFGNQPQQQSQNNRSNSQGYTLIDL
ncbi:ENT1-like protein [Saccharomyces kudriavzevii IFO 1802]|uniref:ENT1-like protein n=2 Tax=Saccharomyces kudriavzevii (strain ATCC MYA-4449 / AS 2.2408 / CBS 8840 / NBRC 1802 / NCYC 2889) TaxID=226230 RepID=J4U508_SACK1|nr:ENT1-like protein [Saccharomyces kudriavzevii IFO 1802]